MPSSILRAALERQLNSGFEQPLSAGEAAGMAGLAAHSTSSYLRRSPLSHTSAGKEWTFSKPTRS